MPSERHACFDTRIFIIVIVSTWIQQVSAGDHLKFTSRRARRRLAQQRFPISAEWSWNKKTKVTSADIGAGLKSRQKFMKFDHGERLNPATPRLPRKRKNTRLTFHASVSRPRRRLRFDLGTRSRIGGGKRWRKRRQRGKEKGKLLADVREIMGEEGRAGERHPYTLNRALPSRAFPPSLLCMQLS